MKLGKATIYFYGLNGYDALDELKFMLENEDYIHGDIFDVKEVEIGEWHDGIDLNRTDCTKDTYENYFRYDRTLVLKIAKDIAEIMKTSHYTGINFDKAEEMVLAKHRELTGVEKDILGQQVDLMLP